MALLKFKGNEARTLSIYGNFAPGETKEVPNESAKNLVVGNSDLWEIVAPAHEVETRRKKYAEDRKLDTKKED